MILKTNNKVKEYASNLKYFSSNYSESSSRR